MLGYLKELLGVVCPSGDPMGPAGQGDVAVTVDHSGNDGRTTGVDHLRTLARIRLVVAFGNPSNRSVFDQHADAQSEGV